MSLPLTFASDFIRLNFIAVETVVHPFVSVFLICFGLRRLLKISQSFPPISHTEFTGIFTTGHTHSCPRPILSFLDGDSVEDQGACQGPDCTPGLAPPPTALEPWAACKHTRLLLASCEALWAWDRVCHLSGPSSGAHMAVFRLERL